MKCVHLVKLLYMFIGHTYTNMTTGSLVYLPMQIYLSHLATAYRPACISSNVINVFRRQGSPHLGQGHGPIVSSRVYMCQQRSFVAIVAGLIV